MTSGFLIRHLGIKKYVSLICALAQNVRDIQILNSGHWGPEERADFVIKMLDNFVDGNTTTTKGSYPTVLKHYEY